MTYVNVKPGLLRWALDRSGISLTTAALKFPALPAWLRGRGSPSLPQLERFARATHTPVGFLFLDTPPLEEIPIPDFRTQRGKAAARPSPGLLETIYLSHPLPSFGTPASASAIRSLSKAFPSAKILDAEALYSSNADWLKRYRGEISRASAFVFRPYRGTIGYGVYCELCFAEDQGIPVLLLADGKLWNTWNLSIRHHRYQWDRFALISPRGHTVDPSEVKFGGRKPQLMPSGALGRVIENRMIEYLIVLSQGRLVVYRPEADYEGTDLHVTMRHKAPVLKIQVKGITFRNRGTYLRVQVRAAAMPEGDPKYILFVDYDLKAAEPRDFVWFPSSEEYRAKANLGAGYYRASLATSPTANDKWVDCRYNTRDIAWVVEELLKREA
jgi:hypothetical protein